MEKYEALMKDIEEDTSKCKAISCSQTGRINMAEMPSTDSTQSQAKCQWCLHRNRSQMPRLKNTIDRTRKFSIELQRQNWSYRVII